MTRKGDNTTMAKGTKTGGRNIKKGQVLNPKGRPKTHPELKKAREFTKHEVELIIHDVLGMSFKDLGTKLRNRSGSILKIMMMANAAKAISGGDPVRINFMLDRSVGKLKDTLQHEAGETFVDIMLRATGGKK